MAETQEPTKDAGAQGAPASTVPEETKQELIYVVSTLPTAKDGGSPLALHEKNDAHPDGEAFIAGSKAVLVAPTAAVLAKITSGVLRKANGGEVTALKKASAAADKATEEA